MSVRFPSVAAGIALLCCWAAPMAAAAQFSVYFRSSPTGPWTYYVGRENKGAALAPPAELKELGYLREIVDDAEPPPKTIINPVPASSATIINTGASGAV